MASTRRTPLAVTALARAAIMSTGLALSLGAGSAEAQLPPRAGVGAEGCPDGVISQVVVRSLDPYDESSASPDATFGWAFQALNWLHFETRVPVIRWELLFEEGDCLDTLRLSESERTLRSLRYLQSASITSTPLDDGSHRVDVETRDSWAISASLGVDFEGGVTVSGVQASYRNVLGSGLRTSFFRRSFRERLRYGVLARHTNLFGTRIDAVTHGGRTRAGDYFSQSLQKPFLNEFADHAFRQVVARRDDYFAYSLPPELAFSPVYLRYQADLVELAYQTRFGGEGGRRVVLGLGLSHESFRRVGGAEGARAVVEGDFSETVVAQGEIRDEIFAQAGAYSTSRVTGYIGFRDVRHDIRGGLDAIAALQDVLVGGAFTVGVGPGFAVAGGDDQDLLVRFQGRAGLLGGSTYLLARADVQTRRTFSESLGAGGLEVGRGWRDTVGSIRGDGYWTQSDWANLYVRGRVSGGWNTDRPFQLRLGGRESIRAYSEDAFPGGRYVFGSVEQRFVIDPLSPAFADVGAAVFADAGRMWAGDVPFGQDSGWQAGVGAGLRVSPAGGRRVFRADLMLPLTDLRDERGVSLRLYGEIFGILERRRWPEQVDRSRWYGNDPDLSRRVPDPLAGN